MALSKVWVFAEADDDKVKTITLEMLTKAREIGDTVEAVFGGDGDAVAAALGAHGASKVLRDRRSRRPPSGRRRIGRDGGGDQGRQRPRSDPVRDDVRRSRRRRRGCR